MRIDNDGTKIVVLRGFWAITCRPEDGDAGDGDSAGLNPSSAQYLSTL